MRWTIEGEANLAQFVSDVPVVAAFWHQRLALMPALWLRVFRANRGREGKTSGKGGAAGVIALQGVLERGGVAVITPDGPRGPARVAAPGVAHLAALTGAPVLPAAAQCRPRVQLKSWDSMVLPVPFGRGVLVCLPPIQVPPGGAEASLPAIAAAMDEAAARADALCADPAGA